MNAHLPLVEDRHQITARDEPHLRQGQRGEGQQIRSGEAQS
jgi:hypothetical protein